VPLPTALATRWQPLGSGRQSAPGALRDARLAARLAAYKREVAGAYRSLALDALDTVLHAGPCWVSPKCDGMTAVLHRQDGVTVVITPTGQVLADLPLTREADQQFGDWHGLLAGELSAVTDAGRPTIYSLHAALGGGAAAPVDRLCCAAFDVLQDGTEDAQALLYAQRAECLQALLGTGTLAQAVPVRAAQMVPIRGHWAGPDRRLARHCTLKSPRGG